ncbi:MAG: alpha-amylase family glycosyl hydrolase, partial [Chloroflexota bacterium]|nr:alpha-amylase family glycosyl hydrolase [Chloroflexota bacterium]
GYDVADYTAVDPRFGTMADFSEFVVEARDHGLHVIIDLVANHSSDQHRWFQAARQDPTSPYRDYYVWRQDDPGDTSSQVVFPGEQEGIWTHDEQAGAWYLHHFYEFQPDLNFVNPAVREEFRRIIGLWLQLGVDGFCIDAAPFVIDMTGVESRQGMGQAHEFLRELKDFANVRNGNAILLGEVDVSLSALADYFGGGNELQAVFNFPLNRYLFLGLAQESADPIKLGFKELPTIPERGQWVNFLRHHDELNLSRLTKLQREIVFEAFGPEPTMQIFGRGLRRRLAPMLGGDQARLRLAYSLLFSLPGAPMLYYGEEIGMGENLDVPGRLSVRTPMQWAPYAHGGFSGAPPDRIVRPMLADGDYRYERVNVATQRADPDSLLNWLATLMRTRRECGEIGAGAWQAVETGNDAVLGMRYDLDGSAVLVVNNLSSRRATISLAMSEEEAKTATDLLADRRYEPLATDPTNPKMRIEGYGYRWLRLQGIY